MNAPTSTASILGFEFITGSNFSGGLRASKRVEEVLDHSRHYNTSDFLKSLNATLQKLYGTDALLTIIKSGHNGRYFDTISRQEILLTEKDKEKISLSANKPQRGEKGIYLTISDTAHPEDTYSISISGIPEEAITDELLRGIRNLKHQFRKTDTAIKVQNQDTLTGLYNRHFIERYAQDRNKRKDKSYAVVAIDLEDLKGHNAIGLHIGDAALRKVGDILRSVFPRDSDLVGRPGGDEFTIILEFDNALGQDEQEKLVNERMTEVMHQLKTGDTGNGLHSLDGTLRKISLRWGAAYQSDGKTFDERHRRADERSNIGKSDAGKISRAVEAVENTDFESAMRVAQASIRRMGELKKNAEIVS